MSTTDVPIAFDDPVNAKILAVSEDRIEGFCADPFAQISEQSGVPLAQVLERIRAMLEAGHIRRVRQTLMATNLAPGALVAWQVANDRLTSAFDWMFRADPFSGHVVIRTTDGATAGSAYRLWTTLKVPVGFSMQQHCNYLMSQTGATAYRLMPAKRLFTLGVGHVRRRDIAPGERTDEPGRVRDTVVVTLTDLEWRVLTALKREFAREEIARRGWTSTRLSRWRGR